MSYEAAASARFDGAGTATVRLVGPPPAVSWWVTRVAVSTTSTARTAATIYRSHVSPANVIDVAPASGNADTSAIGFTLAPGESLIIQWTGGSVDAEATVTMTYDVER